MYKTVNIFLYHTITLYITPTCSGGYTLIQHVFKMGRPIAVKYRMKSYIYTTLLNCVFVRSRTDIKPLSEVTIKRSFVKYIFVNRLAIMQKDGGKYIKTY